MVEFWNHGRLIGRTVVGAVLALSAMAVGATSADASDLKSIFGKFSAGSAKTIDHAAWTALLKTYLKPSRDGVNRVDYRAFKAKGHSALKAYVARLQKVNVGSLDKKEQFAFWANLYNAKTIDVVLDHYPVSSIRKITISGGLFNILKSSVGAGGPWKAKIMTVGGQRLSLDDVEHEIMRKVFKDPRVHYAVNCASIGCPNLASEAFVGAKLNRQLDAGAVAYVNHPRGISVSGGSVKASNIYKWFVADFGGNAAGVLRHMRKYAKPPLAAKLKGVTEIDSYAYDWALNDVK